jgi:hypothetical protein
MSKSYYDDPHEPDWEILFYALLAIAVVLGTLVFSCGR